MAQTSKFFRNAVAAELRRRFAMKMVILTSFFSFPGYGDFEENDDYILIRHTSNIRKVLLDFGASIRNLKIEHIPKKSKAESLNIYKLIEEHCSETLVQLHLKWIGQSFFAKQTKQFKKVENISLEGNIIELGNDQISFRDCFPAMRQLYIGYIKVQDTKFKERIDVNFAHLERLTVDIFTKESAQFVETESLTMELIRKNPQIQSMTLRNVSPDLLKAVADRLPNLKKLELYNFDEDDKNTYEFHFEQVKQFRIGQNNSQSMLTNITFSDKLEEFEVEALPNDLKYCLKFLEGKYLRKFTVFGDGELTNDDILRMTNIKLNIIEMSLNCAEDVQDENIAGLIENSRELNKLHLNFYKQKNEMSKMVFMLREHFEDEWMINDGENDIFLQRKKI